MGWAVDNFRRSDTNGDVPSGEGEGEDWEERVQREFVTKGSSVRPLRHARTM